MAVLFGLFVVPRFLQRFRIPTAVTSVLIGLAMGAGFGWFQGDSTIRLLSLFGIVSLFLFAGLEVNLKEMQAGRKILISHVVIFVAVLILVSILIHFVFGLEGRPSIILALALLTPSTGFILDSLPMMGLTGSEPFWVKSKAIATEIVALGALFVTLQSTTWSQFIFSAAILAVMIFILPILFRLFAEKIVPFAPKSEFTFLLMMAVLCAFITRKLGVYYLVGAFVVGIAARRYRGYLPGLSSEKMLHAIEAFASFFIPFYFLNAGLELERDDIGLFSIGLGILLLLVLIPFRVFWVAFHRHIFMKEPVSSGMRVGMSIIPTLVFTLVLAEILRVQFHISPIIFGALIVYGLVNTITPSFIFHLPAPDFETPELPLEEKA